MTPNISIDFGPNPPGVDPGQDHNRSNRMYSNDLKAFGKKCCYF